MWQVNSPSLSGSETGGLGAEPPIENKELPLPLFDKRGRGLGGG